VCVLGTLERYWPHNYAQNQMRMISWQGNGDGVCSGCGAGGVAVPPHTLGRSQILEEREQSSQALAYPEQVCNLSIFSLDQPRWDAGWSVSVTLNVALEVLSRHHFARPIRDRRHDKITTNQEQVCEQLT
jgi:hypothetical protein